MVVPAFLLVLTQIALVHGSPVHYIRQKRDGLQDRAVVLSPSATVTTVYESTLASLQSVTGTAAPSVTGSIVTGLPSGGATQDPLKTPEILQPEGTLAPTDSTLAPGPTGSLEDVGPNIFVPMPSDAPPQQIVARDDHVVKKLNIIDDDVPIATNKFYANFYLGTQSQPVWTHPYSLTWANGSGNSYGMAVSHIEREQLSWGEGDVPRYFIGPVGLQHVVLSAAELVKGTVLSTEKLTGFSVHANLAPSANSDPILTIPCVQGMGFVTGLYSGATPHLSSGIMFRTLEYADQIEGGIYKYRIQLEDDSQWLLYVTPIASLGAPPFTLKGPSLIEGPEGFTGTIQVAKNPGNATEQVYDSSAGVYAVDATISGTTNGGTGSYTIKWDKGGLKDQTLLMFTLPHHLESLDEQHTSALTDIELVTTTKGVARAIVADQITMVEQNLPETIGFGPWVPNGSGGAENSNLNDGARALVHESASKELAQDFDAQTRLDSMYYSGKGLAKFASIIYTVQAMAKETELAAAGLAKLKEAFDVFVTNKQPLPLVYDSVWKGVVSSGTYKNGDTGLDFGNTLYNDHHFHYGYFVWTAAVIGHLDPSWLDQGTNKAWVNMLVRDYANPSNSDPHFPFQRAFDWYMGHSWAKGLFESGDGKDQESTSEDTFATLSLKMWGKITGDANMEARANLQLAVQARSLSNYFLYQSDNKVQPDKFIANKVSGILFENKIDHTTYFGTNIEYIQGIHMVPINPSSAYTRPNAFVKEEWNAYFSQGRADQVEGGWRGILYANLALIDPVSSYKFFADPNFDYGLLDGGASRTWYLAYAAALGGGT